MTNTQISQAIHDLQIKYRTICKTVKCCLGISAEGDVNLFLNQQGNWVSGGGGSSYTFDNGLTETAGNVQLGGTLIQNTIIDGTFGDISTIQATGDDLAFPFPGITVDGFMQYAIDNNLGILYNMSMGSSNALAPYQLSVFNTGNGKNARFAFNSASATNEVNALFGVGNGFSTGLFYGFEAWTERSECNMYITDQGVDDIGRVNLGCLPDFSDAWYNVYIPDVTTYTSTSSYGILAINATETDGITLEYKAERNGYVYADQTLRSILRVKDGLTLEKPASGGNVFEVSKEGNITVSGGHIYGVRTEDYGSPLTFDSDNYHLVLEGAGTGTTNIDISNIIPGRIAIISDLDFKAGANNIVIDSGTGNTITSLNGVTQTYTISTDGGSVTIQRITATKFKVI